MPEAENLYGDGTGGIPAGPLHPTKPGAAPKGIPLKDLAAALHLTPGTVSELVEKLVRKGTLQRVQNPDDRRAVMISVTEKSLTQLSEAMGMINAYVDELWKDFSEEEKKQLTTTLELLATRIEAEKA